MGQNEVSSAPSGSFWGRRLAALLILVMLLGWAGTVYYLAPESSALWDPPLTFLFPFGQDEVLERKDKDEVKHFGLVRFSTEKRETGDPVEKVLLFPDADQSREPMIFLKKEVEYQVRHVPIRAMLLIAAGIFLLSTWFALPRLMRRMALYKPAQGRWVRVGAYLMILALILYGSVSFYRLPRGAWWQPVAETTFLGTPVALRPVLFPAMAMGFLAVVIVQLLLNRPKWGEFLIESEGELRKVSWPTRREYLGSSMVVVVVTAGLTLFIWGVDEFLSFVFEKLGIGI